MKRNISQKGFTLIELLVVVAIIVILSTTILVALGQARTKARDARAASELSSMRAQAEIYYNEHGFSYIPSGGAGGGCTAANLIKDSITENSLINFYASLKVYPGDTKVVCNVSAAAWAVAIELSKTVNCADSNGVSKVSSEPLATAIDTGIGGPVCK